MTHLITFACYGGHLHGDGCGTVDPTHNERIRVERILIEPDGDAP